MKGVKSSILLNRALLWLILGQRYIYENENKAMAIMAFVVALLTLLASVLESMMDE